MRTFWIAALAFTAFSWSRPTAGPVTAVRVTPASDTVQVGDTARWIAQAVDASGAPVGGLAYTWGNPGNDLFSYVSKSGPHATGIAKRLGLDTAVVTVTQSGRKFTGRGLLRIAIAPVDTSTPEPPDTTTPPPVDTTKPPPIDPNAVVLDPSDDVQSAVNSHPTGTTFRLKEGIYRNMRVVPKSGDTFVGDPGAVLDGGNTTLYAFDKGPAPWPSKVTIRGFEIRGYASPDHMGPILAGGNGASDGTVGWVIENVDVHNNRVGGVRVGHKTIVRNSKFHHNGWAGLMGAGDSVLIENNEISYNNVSGTPGTVTVDPNWAGGGFKFVYTRWLVVRNNFSHHNSGAGMWTDLNNIYSTYDGNRVEDNTHVGIFHEISYDAVIKNNIVKRNGFGKQSWVWGPGILVAASPNTEVFGNTVEGNYNGITVVQQTRGEKATYGPHLVKNVHIHDNNINMSARGVSGFAQDVGNTGLFTLSTVKFTANKYQLGTNARPFHWQNGTRNVSEWQGYGQDVGGTFNR